tara:strand:+ start:538 stop:1131 length:594 start_codon:yes stop_codon:yes gene_type:complete
MNTDISTVQKFGYYLPFVVAGTSITAIGYGLFSILEPSSSTAHWVGFEVVFGLGAGCAGAMAFIAMQSAIPAAQISVAMGTLLFIQNLGGAVWLTIPQIIFSSSLRSTIPHYAPDVDARTVIAAGANSVREVVSGTDLPGVLKAYNVSINRVMYMGVGIACAAFVCGWWMGWKNVRPKKTEDGEQGHKNEKADEVAV